MAGVTSKSFDSPDETRTPDRTQIAKVRLGTTTAGRFTMQPGWRWSECIKPIAGTETCQAHHVGVAVAGRLHIAHTDGSVIDLTAGDAYEIEPGHDAWVLGDDAFVGYEFESQTAETYAKK